MIVAILALVCLGFSLLLNLSSVFSEFAGVKGSRAHGGIRLDEVVVQDNGSRNKIALIPVTGVITGDPVGSRGHSMVDVIREQFDRAANDKRVKAVILHVDSPGGEVLASDEIHRIISEFQADTDKPVLACMGSVAASGGYYVAAPCEYIMAHEMTITGSIGVIISTWNYRGLMDKVGLSPYTFKSGKFKDMLSGERAKGEIPEGERELVQGWIDETFSKFKSIVREGREAAAAINEDDGRPLVANWESYCDGRIFTGTEAKRLGFVDDLGNLDDAIAKTLEIAGLDEANVVEYRTRNEFADLLGLFGRAPSEAAVKLDLGIHLPKLHPGQAYFLYLP